MSAHGTQAFAPPELLAAWRDQIGPTSPRPALRGLTTRDAWLVDVFALGMVLKMMLIGSLGLPPARAEQPALCGCCVRRPPPIRRTRDEDELPADAADLLRRMTARVPAERADIGQAMEHAWMLQDQETRA